MFVVQHRISTLHFSLAAKDLRMQFISKRSDKMHLNYFIMNLILIENCFPCKLFIHICFVFCIYVCVYYIYL